MYQVFFKGIIRKSINKTENKETWFFLAWILYVEDILKEFINKLCWELTSDSGVKLEHLWFIIGSPVLQSVSFQD